MFQIARVACVVKLTIARVGVALERLPRSNHTRGLLALQARPALRLTASLCLVCATQPQLRWLQSALTFAVNSMATA